MFLILSWISDSSEHCRPYLIILTSSHTFQLILDGEWAWPLARAFLAVHLIGRGISHEVISNLDWSTHEYPAIALVDHIISGRYHYKITCGRKDAQIYLRTFRATIDLCGS